MGELDPVRDLAADATAIGLRADLRVAVEPAAQFSEPGAGTNPEARGISGESHSECARIFVNDRSRDHDYPGRAQHRQRIRLVDRADHPDPEAEQYRCPAWESGDARHRHAAYQRCDTGGYRALA